MGIEDAFTFVAPVMPRRRIDPFAIRLAIAAAAFVALVGAFGAFVVQHERAAEAERAANARAATAAIQAETAAAAQEALAAGAGTLQGLVDDQARESLLRSLELARSTMTRGAGFEDVDTATLAGSGVGLVYVDGPSTAPSVVSVASRERAWGAAIMGPSGVCYRLRADVNGGLARDIGGPCTGRAALDATGSEW